MSDELSPSMEELDALTEARDAAKAAERDAGPGSLDAMARLGWLRREMKALLGEPFDPFHDGQDQGMQLAMEILCAPKALLFWEKIMREQRTWLDARQAKEASGGLSLEQGEASDVG